ncbi:MAG TPA: HAD family hydrolase [Gaiellales bacterium]|nr:HAD family hydrolase [Gaiellales bacterium]
MLRAVAFDYRDTLAEFRWDEALWRRGVEALVAGTGAFPDAAGRVGDGLRRRFTRTDGDPAELDYPAAVTGALREAGIDAAPEAVRRGIEAEYRTWAPARHVHPDTPALLDGVRALGLRSAVAANTFDPPDLVRAELADQDIAGRVDAVVLSCEVGVRKPDPRFFAAVGAALRADPGETMFVGDSVRDDVAGAAAAGMRSCLATWYRQDPEAGGRGVTMGTEPLHVVQILEGIVESGRAGKI